MFHPDTHIKPFIECATSTELESNSDELRTLVDQDPRDLVAAMRLAEAYRQQGRIDELMELLLTQAEHAGTDQEAARVLRRAAITCSDNQQHEAALEILLLAMRRDPRDGDLLDLIDDLAYQTQNFDGVLRAYLDFAETTRDRTMRDVFWLRIACLAACKAQGDEAMRACRRIKDLSNFDAPHILARSGVHLKGIESIAAFSSVCDFLGLHLELEGVLTRAIDACADEDDRVALLDILSRSQVAAGTLMRATETLNKLVTLTPMDRERVQLLAQVYRDLGQSDRADQALNAFSIERERVSAEALNQAYRSKRWEECLPLFERSIEKDRASEAEIDSTLWLRACACAYELQRYRQAISWASELVRDQSDNVDALMLLKRSYLAVGESGKAAQWLSRQAEAAAAQGAEDAHVSGLFKESALMAWEAKDMKSALRDLKRAEVLDADNTEVLELIAQLQDESGDIKDATRVRVRLLPLVDSPKQFELLRTIGHSLRVDLKRPRKAMGYLRQALKINSRDDSTHDALLSIYRELGLWEDALATLLTLAELRSLPSAKKGDLYEARAVVVEHSKPEDVLDDLKRVLNGHFDSGCVDPTLEKNFLETFTAAVSIYHDRDSMTDLSAFYESIINRFAPQQPIRDRLERDLRVLAMMLKKAGAGVNSEVSSAPKANETEGLRAPNFRCLTEIPADALAQKTKAPFKLAPARVSAAARPLAAPPKVAPERSPEHSPKKRKFIESPTMLHSKFIELDVDGENENKSNALKGAPQSLPVAGKKSARRAFHQASTRINHVEESSKQRSVEVPSGKKQRAKFTEASTHIVRRGGLRSS